MTAQQLDAHAAQILHLSVCDPNSTAVIDLQQQHTPATAGANGGGGSGYSNAGGASHESQAATPENSGGNKRKRRPAGTPDPDAEVVALSPKTLMESDRYICEICNQGFQRDQNLQMHRRRHKVPWKLLKKARLATHKRVYVCPELTCLHHDPAHALGDLVGIKKHFRRKHCTEKQWVCDKCSKGYAVQSDYKAHLKTCGTRGHCCDCGKVFSRVESFIEHQDTCAAAIQKGSMQSGNDSKSTLQRSTTTTSRRNVSSTESPSQSSADTSGPALFTLSGISDNTAPSTDHSSRLNEQVSTRLDSSTSHAATNVIPPWLPERRNELQQLLPSTTTQAERLESYSSEAALASTAQGTMRLQGVSGSRSQITRCSSKNSGIICPEVSISECKSLQAPRCLSIDELNTPSLQLTIGPGYSTKSTEVISSEHRVQYVTPEGTIDTKPHRNTVDKLHVQPVAISNFKQLRAGSAVVEVAVTTTGSNTATSVDLPLSFPMSTSVQVAVNNDMTADGKIRKASAKATMINDFRTTERFGLARRCEETSRAQGPSNNLAFSQQELAARVRSSDCPGIKIASASPSYHTPYGSGNLTSQGDLRERNESETVRENFISDQRRSIVQQSALQAAQGSTQEPHNNAAGDPVHTHSRDNLPQDVSPSEFLIVARTLEEPSAQKELTATAFAEASKTREQARTEMNTAWSDLAAARRTKEQARLESTEAQNEIARAELLKREAREQLQQASAEKALADHARDMAKRQMDIAEAELADAKRIREHAQAEIEKSRLLKDQQSRESLHKPLHDAAMRVSSRDHNLQMSSNYICEVCKSVPVGRDLALGLHQSTNRTPMMMPSRVGSWPESTADHKIRLSQINAPNEVNTRTGLVNYLTTRENTSEPSPSYNSYNEPNPTRLFSHMIGEPSTCRSWSVGSGASDAGEGRSSCEFLEASVPTIATFATSMTVQAPSTSKNPRTSTDHYQSQGS